MLKALQFLLEYDQPKAIIIEFIVSFHRQFFQPKPCVGQLFKIYFYNL